MIILPFIPILALIIQTSISLNDILKYQAESMETEAQVSAASYIKYLLVLENGVGNQLHE